MADLDEEGRLDLLQRASAELSKPGDVRDRLERALRLLLPRICQQVVLEIYELDGSSHDLVTAFVDPDREQLAKEICARYQPKPVAHPKAIVGRTGEPMLVDVSDQRLLAIAHDDEHLEMLRRLGASHVFLAPLHAGDRMLGVFSAATEGQHRIGKTDQVLLELFVERLASHLDSAYFRRRVLLVEDDSTRRSLLEKLLRRAGFTVREATTGAEAIALARETTPDVVVLDEQHARGLGFEVLRRLKDDPLTIGIPVVQLSAAFIRPEHRKAALQGGAGDHVVAPIEPGDLVATIHSVLRTAEGESEGRRVAERERRARVELERTNAKLRAVTESGILGMFEWDGEGAIVEANETFLTMIKRTREDVIARRLTLANVLTGDLLPKGTMALPTARSTLAQRELVASDGSSVSVMLGVTHLKEPRGHGLAIVLDVSEQRRRSELEQLLIGVVSHDLRNPLGVVTLGATMLLTQGQLTEAQRRTASRIHSAGNRAVRMIGDLLDFTVARERGIELSRRPVDLHAVVEQAIDDLHASWPARTILHDKSGDAHAELDQDRIAQVVSNLVGNALQHSIATTPVRVETRGEPEEVVFVVANDGRPIPDNVKAQLFEPLRRGDGAGHRRGSLGLGLYIVHHLVVAHGGTIDVVSNEHDGTRFSVRLPRHPPTPA